MQQNNIEWIKSISGRYDSKCGSFLLVPASDNLDLYTIYDLRFGYPQHPVKDPLRTEDAMSKCELLANQKMPTLPLIEIAGILSLLAIIILIIYWIAS